MDSTELTRALRAATEDLAPRPGFTAEVIRGGRRRRVRSRVMVATAAATVTALAGGATYVIWLDPGPETQVADARLTQPARGNLAGDREFVNAAAAAWRSGRAAERVADLRGQPHVYWAGDTPAGRAAVVVQGLYESGELDADDPDRTTTLIGLVATDPADGRLKVVTMTRDPLHNPSNAHAFMFGPGDRTILVVAGDSPLWLSTSRDTGPDGRIIRDWQPMPITDGVAVASLPEGANPYDARVHARKTPPAPNDTTGTGMLYLEPASYYLERTKPGNEVLPNYPETDKRLKWWADDAKQMRVGDTGVIYVPGEPNSVFVDAVKEAGMTDSGARTTGWGGWTVQAGLANGRTALVSEQVQDQHPSRIYTVMFTRSGTVARVIAGAPVDPMAALPVAQRLPDGQGWVIAQYGARLAYRLSADAQWVDAGSNAALLPDAATQVRVTNDGGPAVVDLPR